MYKYIGLALMSVFAIMVIPAQQDTTTGLSLYGMGTLIVNDATGNEVFAQTIHNRVVDQGEAFIIDQTFDDGTAAQVDNVSVGAICISNNSSFTASVAETLDAATFDGADSLIAANCKQETAGGVVDSTASTAVITPAAFTTSNLDAAGETIFGIGVCQNESADDNDYANCATGSTTGILFAAFDTTDVTLATGETVLVTYTFDITSSGN